MTFDEFQSTREYVDDIGAAVGADIGTATPVAGNIYLGSFYIEWSPEAKAAGAWHLILFRDEYISDDLSDLERKLYDWTKSEGYLDGSLMR